MSAVTPMPRGRDWTVDDLARLPDDGLQYELADGVLLVTPGPVPVHQRACARLYLLLAEACPPGLEVFFAPLDYQPTRRRSLQPDLLVVRPQDVGPTAVSGLVLAVEVLSPSTRSKDLLLKRALYEDGGVASYWVVDPDEPSLVAWELRGGRYVEVASVRGDEPFAAAAPFEVTVVPSALVG
jgi:Uma2 family endonuclease